CRCVLLLTVLTAFGSLARTTADCISSLCAFMELATPVLMTLLTAIGGTASVGVFQPAMTLLSSTVSGVIAQVIVPLTFSSGVLGVLDRLSPRMRVSELAGLIRSAAKWTVGALTTVYLAATSIRGMTASAYDGISVRAARYAAGSMTPMFGGLVTGSFDTALGCAALVKNAVGLTAMLLALGTIALPMLRMLAYQLLMRLASAIAEPVAGKLPASMLKSGADMIAQLSAACMAVALMFIVTLGLITGLGNGGFF
ncbi:MAG: stage III sporulation protein AE, partial [Clostridia bacterium]|nr:stage III sporulation protein AE [Clostridia bacterium]